MSEDDMLKCLIAFVLGFLVAHMIRGNGLSVGGVTITDPHCGEEPGKYNINNCLGGYDNNCNGDNRYCTVHGWCAEGNKKTQDDVHFNCSRL
jgi:hypothetical protein